MTVERVFLDWVDAQGERSPLPAAAARWLHERFGDDMADVLVAVPGRHALRRLEEHLARVCGKALQPPTVTTAGRLTDRILRPARPVASRLQRSLAWARSLADLAPPAQRALLARPPAKDDVDGWWELAVSARQLTGDLRAEGRTFDDVVARLQRMAPGEVPRWRALASAHRAYLARLQRLGVDDPHEARWDALQRDAYAAPRAVVLVGVPELRALDRQLIARLADRCSALVYAPESEQARHDVLGCVTIEGWADAHVPLDTSRWSVVERPAHQALWITERLTELAAVDGSDAPVPGGITLGVPDPDVQAYVERQVARLGGRTRRAEGTSLAGTSPARLLAALADWLTHGLVADLAALVRHPDLEPVLDGGHRAAEHLDAYHARHLPQGVPDRWRRPDDARCEVDGRARHERDEARALDALSASLRTTLGELHGKGRRRLAEWAPALAAFLRQVYGKRELPRPGRSAPGDPRALVSGALAQLRELLDDLSEADDDGPVDAASAVRVLLRTASEADQRVSAPSDPDALALHGWLDLVHDDAPRLLLTGFNEGHVPDLDVADRFLPDGLREALDLPTSRARLARDVWALVALLRSRDTWLATGRVTRLGDPVLPSRLAFHASNDEVVARVQHLLAQGAEAAPPVEREAVVAPPAPPLDPCPRPVTSLSVTDFRTWLSSPYSFHVERQLRLQAADDGGRELDARTVGNLAHEVLEAFGTSPVASSTDAEAIHAWLQAELERQAAERHGPEAAPAVSLQVLQLGLRFKGFARWQAAHAAAGWRIAHVEWGPEGGSVPLVVDGETLALRGRIDRIDVHPQHGCALYDYKSGDNARAPDKTHRDGAGNWVDLQLPLYRELVRELDLPEPMALGYLLFPRKGSDAGEHLAEWTSDDLDEALQVAHDVVRAVRAGELTRAGEWKPWSDASLQAMHRSRLRSAEA